MPITLLLEFFQQPSILYERLIITVYAICNVFYMKVLKSVVLHSLLLVFIREYSIIDICPTKDLTKLASQTDIVSNIIVSNVTLNLDKI